ncbi:MAG: D-alanine--D-alanine ligase family protein [Microbacteriaceae bacterium]|jgi:D-alanine-D-alanine ligase
MTATMTIAVLSGGISHEREISLRTGRRVADALSDRGHSVVMLDPDADLFARLDSISPDVVWPALHGSSGEDGALLGLLTAHGLLYVGPAPSSARLAWSKPVAKTLVERAGVATATSLTVTREAFRELGAANVLRLIVDQLGEHVVVKPAQGGSAQGVTIVSDPERLPRAMVDAFTYHDVAIVEMFIGGTEVSATVVDIGEGPRVLPLVEIVPLDGTYSFEARYTAGETNFFVPARMTDVASASAVNAALAAHAVLGLGDLSRIDLIVNEHGVAHFLEANTLPGLTETSSAPLAIEAAELALAEVYELLARRAAARPS